MTTSKAARRAALTLLTAAGHTAVLTAGRAVADPMPGMSMPQTPGPATATHADTSMKGMGMSSSIDLNDPMSQEASGTAWVPSSTPTYAHMEMKPNGDMLMLHGAIMPRYTDVGSKRGDRRADAPNWFMGMYSHPVGSRDQIGVRAMISLDPVTEGGYGYPLLFQTGESWHKQPLHDRQHPHDLFDELALSYSHLLGGGKSVYLYAGYPGEPALGPPTYMHRLLASDYADAPIGHHWQDATHVTFGVVTAGVNVNSKVKLEASNFTGREPDENRYSFDKPRFDSYSTRLSYNPDQNNALQVSYGLVHNPEGDGADVHRTTASWIYNRPLGMDANFTTALVWGQNDNSDEGISNSYLAEADYQHNADTLFTRIENIQKSGHELVLPAPYDTAKLYDLGAYTVGYVRDLTHGKGIDTGLGFAVTANTKPSSLDPFYGGGTPLSFEVYLRLRPSRMKGMSGGKMAGMDMSGSASMPGMDMSNGNASMPGMDMSGGNKNMPGPDMTPKGTETTPSPGAQAPVTGTATPGTTAPATGTATPGAQAPAPAASEPVSIASVTAAIAPNPPKARAKNVLTIALTGSDGKPLAGAAVKIAVAMTSMDMGTSHPAVKDLGDGSYRASVAFSMPGPWRVTVTATSSGGRPVTKSFDYSVTQ